MSGRFILSFDCEGKWGVADHLETAHGRWLDRANLERAYRRLFTRLDQHDVAATFAFAGCFARSLDELRRMPLGDLAQCNAYLAAAAAGVERGEEGWDGAWALELLHPRHELALHGVTHTPWTDLTVDAARAELALAPIAGAKTFVYPRNRIAHTELLREAGFLGFRQAPSVSSRFQAFVSEFDVFSCAPDTDPARGDFIAIPGGRFVNWRSGARRLVPVMASRLRARRLLERAASEGALVHYWSHPENFATAPGTFDVLEAILEELTRFRDRGEIEVVTQEQYCLERLSAPAASLVRV
jgi:peptidoglycan/xylan/chitin deacetylase (PgdA/CDA1 family)